MALNDQTLAERVMVIGPGGIHHIVEVAGRLGLNNVDADVEILKVGGSIGAYATENATPKIPFWLMVCFEIGERIPLTEIARAHALAEHPVRRGRIVVTV